MMSKKPKRYWIGYLRISKFKYKLLIPFSNLKCGKKILPYIFFISRKREAKIFKSDVQKVQITTLKLDSAVADHTYSRSFLQIKRRIMEAIEFAQWILNSGYVPSGKNDWLSPQSEWVSSEQLYDIFKNQ